MNYHSGIAACNDVAIFRDMPCRTYAEAEALIKAVEGSRGGWIRTMAQGVCITKNAKGNVYLRRRTTVPLCIELVLYRTVIVRYYKNDYDRSLDSFSVSNGGFNTPTTATRLRQFTPEGYWFWHHRKKLCGVGGSDLNHDIRFRNNKQEVAA